MTTPITGQGLNVCIPPDDELSSTSKKAAQNKVITEEFTNVSNAISEKITSPSSPSTGAFLVWNGTAWVAQTLTTWQGGNY